MRNSNSSKALTDILSLASGEMIGKIAGFLAFTYLARILTPDTYGEIELALGILGLYAVLVDFGLGPIGAKTVAQKPESAHIIASQILGARIIIALLCIPIMVLTAFLFATNDNIKWLITIMSASLIFCAINQKWLLQGLENMKLVSVFQMLKMTSFLICTISFVHIEYHAIRLAYIEIFSAALVATYFLFLQWKFVHSLRISLELAPLLKLFGRAKFIAASHLSWSLTQAAPMIILAATVGTMQVAWFGAAYRITNAFVSFTVIYHFSMYPTISRRLSESQESFQRYTTPSLRITGWGGMFVAYTTTIYSSSICQFVFGQTYTSSSPTLSILIWIVPITLVSGHARWALVGAEKQQHLLTANLTGCIVCCLCCIALAPRFGAYGAATAMVISYLSIWAVAQYQSTKCVVKIPLQPLMLPTITTCSLLIIGLLSSNDSVYIKPILMLIFILVAYLLDKELRHDIPRLIRIKEDLN